MGFSGATACSPSAADERNQRSRLSISIRQAWFIIPLGVSLLVGLVGASLYYYFSLAPISLRFAVGPPASEDSRLVQALAQHFAHDHVSIRLTPVIEEGAAAAAHAIDTNEADLAIVRRDVAYPQTGQAIAELRESVVAIIVVFGTLCGYGSMGTPAASSRAMELISWNGSASTLTSANCAASART